jgi:hypothetical protein
LGVALAAQAAERKTATVPAEFRNPWTTEMEAAMSQRAEPLIAAYKGKSNPLTTGEGEKWGLPATILAYLAGDRDAALTAMQAEDNQAGSDHVHTRGIDLYWCFTLKGQMRKYFLFGDEFAPAYRQRFKEAGKLWTAEDPRPSFETILLFDDPHKELHAYAAQALEKMTGEKFGTDREKWRAFWGTYAAKGWKEFEEYERIKNIRPHPKYGVGTGPVGATWDPAVRGFWADARNTDNLRGMREVAVYLMAEEAGNERTRQIFKAKILRTAKQFLGVGMGEWDSEGYHGHSTAAYLNLYDFAKDPEVKLYAKAILDYLTTCGAVKYFHGSWGGPVKRDYGNVAPWSTTACTMYPWFGAAPKEKAEADLEQAFVLTSAYRPPPAVVAFAQKNFAQPVEMLNSHPAYEAWLPGADEAPEFHETMYYGKTFQLGTAVEGNNGDMNGFKLLVANAEGTADYLVAGSSTKANPGNVCIASTGDRVAQYRHLALWLNAAKPDANFFLTVPKNATLEDKNGIKFIKCHKTFVALHPINLTWTGTTTVKGKSGPGVNCLTGKGGGGTLAGFAMEVGEGDYDRFVAGTLTVAGTTAELIAKDGAKVKMTVTGKELPEVWRNGQKHDWTKHMAVYQTTTDGSAKISLGWKERKFHVECAGKVFAAQLTDDGKYTFTNR